MDTLTYNYLTETPSHARKPLLGSRECRLCNFPSHHYAYVDFNKSCNNYPFDRSGLLVEYFRCQRCELLFTDFFDDWSKEDFYRFIYNHEYINVDPDYEIKRPNYAAQDLTPTLAGAEGVKILDFGSGSGAFEREMR